ncbi:hypothetical protein F0P96_12205 [Hymenobacter busanensis]|uniref:DUF8201 domain-containing protein n=1 Tax=Hymenobacter busanensis TaxID=2607656 RepID=A0A7L4ZVF6_9BACT|nr:hypothetical protein [Hymenobacter busanensis]KAA9332238.1 hypothetical protein F0P96_12205 [Hymenobacter busanensis]QHJ07424.1 hypothetical protein GUY19_09065 [Hymenobacter busanensis]
MLIVLITWLVAALITCVWGTAAYRLLGHSSRPTDQPTPAPEWLSAVGLSALIAFLQLWSLAGPVGAARWPVALLTAIGAVVCRREIGSLARRGWPAQWRAAEKWSAALLVVLLGWIVVYASQRPMSFDVGLYTLQTLQWAEHFPAVPGLGNLHGRLAFNSSWFLPTALLRVSTPVGPAYGLSSYSLALLAVAAARAVGTGWRNPKAAGAGAWVPLLLLFLLLYVFQSRLSSALTDGPMTGLLALLLLHYAALWRRYPAGLPPAEARAVVLLAVTLVTIKLSALPVVLLALHAAWAIPEKRPRIGWWLSLGGVAAVLALPWVVRNAVLSGYLVYPLPALDVLTVDWKIPLTAAQAEQNLIVNLARNVPHAVAAATPQPHLRDWFANWWQLSFGYQQAILVAAALSVVAAAWRWRRGVPATETGWAVGWIMAWLGTWFWLLVAPDFRFGMGFMLTATLWPWAAAHWPWPSPRVRYAVAALLGLWVAQQMRDPLYHLRTTPRQFATRVLWPEAAPMPETEWLPASPGTWVRVPRTGLQCYGAPLPCAMCAEAGLERRGPSLANGFRRQRNH